MIDRTRFVAAIDGEVAGTVSGGASTFTGTAAVTSMWVDPRFRGQGVGKLLLETVLEWAKSEGYRQIDLWVTDGNTNAERLYERHGFTRTGDVSEVRPGEARLEYAMSRAL